MSKTASSKKIVMYFKKERSIQDPFREFEAKKNTYYSLFQKGTSMGIKMYLASGEKNYLGNMRFKNPFFYNGDSFVPCTSNIYADSVFDRSSGLSFPSPDISYKTLNGIEFKRVCESKNLMYELLGNYMPKSVPVKGKGDLLKKLSLFDSCFLVVLKPSNGLGGENIIIDHPDVIKKAVIKEESEYTLQEFVDTSLGISGITNNRHDLRVVIVGGNMIFSTLRTPRKGSYLANVSQGGLIREIPLEIIPSTILEVVKKIQAIIDQRFNYPIYSIDFGIVDKKPYVFELNDRIGFPTDDMPSAPYFIDSLLQSLIKLAKK